MIQKILAAMLTVLIAVNALAAYGTILGNCQEQSCCCAGMSMTGPAEAGQADDKDLKIQSIKGCCCGAAAAGTCGLTAVVSVETIGWALLNNRMDPFCYNLAGMVATDERLHDSAIIFPEAAGYDASPWGSPPMYLSAMSFLC